ncbi:DUF2207 domain-containing protein [Microbacterium sp. YY-01]|uniref:DUF2207 domain-containing protein n=1 Tax=Microbacterium sp. YY-01 TaxID=3421634 RepID=UPI003D175F97
MRTRMVALFSVPFALLLAVLFPSAAAGSVNDFSYSSWHSEFQVGVDSDGRATLHVTETIVAEFPDFDQNRGIIRGLSERYNGVPLHPKVISVTDESGNAVPYETDSDDDVLSLLLGDDRYQHGATTYVIEYTMRDVILQPDDSDDDEFYWDLLPLDSSQDIAQFSADIVFDNTLTKNLLDRQACYVGSYGSDQKCSFEQPEPGHYRVSATNLSARQGVTVAIALQGGVVTPAPKNVPNFANDLFPGLLSLGAAGTALGGTITNSVMARRARQKGRGIIVAEYSVPDQWSPVIAADLVGARSIGPQAHIVHLGVRKVLQIIPSEKKSKKPTLRLINPDAAPTQSDKTMVRALFGSVEPGSTLDLEKTNDSLARALKIEEAAAAKANDAAGYFYRRRSVVSMVFVALSVLLLVAGIILVIPGASAERGMAIFSAFGLGAFGIFLVIPAVAALLSGTRIHTKQGAEAWEYLQGVREFIRVAETDRIAMLQSYSGAERRSDGSVDVIFLYEKLLPYAMIFGLEKEWGAVLETTYSTYNTQPDWITVGTTMHLSRTLRTLNSGLTPTVTKATSSSSSSSGSFGGGFSGGGGGGGTSGGR